MIEAARKLLFDRVFALEKIAECVGFLSDEVKKLQTENNAKIDTLTKAGNL